MSTEMQSKIFLFYRDLWF